MELPAKYSALSPSERRATREEYARRQSGMCQFCGVALAGPPASRVRNLPINRRLFPKTFFDWPVHLHHSHETGMTIGAVHNYCNAVLWQYHGE